MREQKGDIWEYVDRADAICIGLSGFIRDNKCADMSYGESQQANDLFPGLDLQTGNLLRRKWGTQVLTHIGLNRTTALVGLLYLAGEPFVVGHCSMIGALVSLVQMANEKKWNDVVLIQPGFYLPEEDAKWDSRNKRHCKQFLDDRFICLTPDDGDMEAI